MSNWEQGKQRSNYHFNKWKNDTDSVDHGRASSTITLMEVQG